MRRDYVDCNFFLTIKMPTCRQLDAYNPEEVMVSADYIQNRFIILERYTNSDTFVAKVVDKETDEICVLRIFYYFEDESDRLSEIEIGCLMEPMTIYTNSVAIPSYWAIVDGIVFLSEYFRPKISVNKSVLFTMPLFVSSLEFQLKNLSNAEIKDILFEIIIALIIFKRNNISHYDLHAGNILLKNMDSYRLYNINEQPFLVKSKYMPVIIDFDMAQIHSGDTLSYTGLFADDWNDIRKIFYRIMTTEDKEKMSHSDESIVFSPIFTDLKNIEIEAGKSVKYYMPMQIQ